MHESRRNPEAALKGFPTATVSACQSYFRTGTPADLDAAIIGIVSHLLPKHPGQPAPVLAGSSLLVEDLGLDSFTMVEMTFIFEDVFGTPLSQEELVKVRTLTDLLALIQRSLPPNK
jgi:acyl carrier protein